MRLGLASMKERRVTERRLGIERRRAERRCPGMDQRPVARHDHRAALRRHTHRRRVVNRRVATWFRAAPHQAPDHPASPGAHHCAKPRRILSKRDRAQSAADTTTLSIATSELREAAKHRHAHSSYFAIRRPDMSLSTLGCASSRRPARLHMGEPLDSKTGTVPRSGRGPTK